MNMQSMVWKTAWLAGLAGLVLMPQATRAAEPGAQCHARARTALEAFTHGKYDQVSKHFAANIADRGTPDAMQAAWTQLGVQFGTFKKLGKLAPRSVNGQDVLVAPLTFSKGELDAIVACNADSQITAFQFVPPSMLPAASGKAAAGKGAAKTPMEKLMAATKAHEHAPHQAIKAHVEPNGVRVMPLAVSSPFGPLPGALTVPAGKGPFPAVVLVQGSGSSDMDETIGSNKPFRDIADGLARAGIASLRYNKRGFVYGKQMAANKTFTVDDEVTNDVLTALHLLARQSSIDPQRVFVLGLSEGALLVPRIVQRDPQLAGGIMLAAPARPLLEVAAEQVRELGAKAGTPKAQIAISLKAIANERALLDKADAKHPPKGKFSGVPQSWWLSLHDYHQLKVARSLHRPLLILQGGSDFQVSPTKDFDVWKQTLADKPNATFHLYPGLSHLFRPAGKTGTVADYLEPRATDAKVVSDIAHWIKAL